MNLNYMINKKVVLPNWRALSREFKCFGDEVIYKNIKKLKV